MERVVDSTNNVDNNDHRCRRCRCRSCLWIRDRTNEQGGWVSVLGMCAYIFMCVCVSVCESVFVCGETTGYVWNGKFESQSHREIGMWCTHNTHVKYKTLAILSFGFVRFLYARMCTYALYFLVYRSIRLVSSFISVCSFVLSLSHCYSIVFGRGFSVIYYTWVSTKLILIHVIHPLCVTLTISFLSLSFRSLTCWFSVCTIKSPKNSLGYDDIFSKALAFTIAINAHLKFGSLISFWYWYRLDFSFVCIDAAWNGNTSNE